MGKGRNFVGFMGEQFVVVVMLQHESIGSEVSEVSTCVLVTGQANWLCVFEVFHTD